MYLCSMKMMWYCMKMVLVAVVMMAAAGGVGAQEASPQRALTAIEAMPRQQAIGEMSKWLDSSAKTGGKGYKKLIASLEEMLSEPTWDTHNEELFALAMEHGATAPCLSDNERLRPLMLLEVVRKNAPGTACHDIDYETLDGNRSKLSEIATPYTLIYFNDPECLSCAKVKMRLDTCTLLRNMVADSTLTVLGIYPYDNTREWKLEPFPGYVINGWDYKQEIEGEQSYDLMTMPQFYLVDREKRVILKNEASLNRILKSLARLKGLEESSIEEKLDAVW